MLPGSRAPALSTALLPTGAAQSRLQPSPWQRLKQVSEQGACDSYSGVTTVCYIFPTCLSACLRPAGSAEPP